MLSNDVKLLAVFDTLEKRVSSLTLKQGEKGPKGDKGEQGSSGEKGDRGEKGLQGVAGAKGETGPKGEDGEAGISVVDVRVDFDNHIVVTLSDGNEIDAGEINIEGTASNYNVHMAGAGAITPPLPSITLINNSNYTTLFDPLEEVIKCTGTALQTITLHQNATQGQRKTIKRLGTGEVTVVGTIDGESSIQLGPDVSTQLIYIDGSWIII